MSEPTKGRLMIPRDFVAVDPPLPTLPVASIEPPVEWMRFCHLCESEQRFIADRVCLSGLIGCCLGCGDERIAPFTRVNSEVA